MIRALLKVSEPNCEVQPVTNYSHDKTTMTGEWQRGYFCRCTKGSIRFLHNSVLLFRKENHHFKNNDLLKCSELCSSINKSFARSFVICERTAI